MVRQTERAWARACVVASLAVVGMLSVGGLGCGVTEEPLPPDIQDPAASQTPSGAVARYRSVLAGIPGMFDSLMTLTGVLTDELAGLPAPLAVSRDPYTSIDSRRDLTGFVGMYQSLHRLRAQAREARGFLQAYAPDSSPALAAHLYAVEGYADVWLADVFCSGIPLSTVDFGADYTLAAGSSTAEVYQHAVALFDSAVALASDSMRVQHLAAIGRGRALLALGQYTEAAAAVAAVPDGYKYEVVFAPPFPLTQRLLAMFGDQRTSSGGVGYRKIPATPSAGNQEGGNGLDYLASGDPRTAATARPGTDPLGNTMYFPNKYSVSDSVTLTVADGVEARLVAAEAALQAGDALAWLAKLNALRTDGTYDTTTASPPDTLWHAGTGGVAGLEPLADPGTADGRVDLLFRERAFWLYLTAHRQGDLRRLIREYLRLPETVYPVGTYPGGPGAYGNEVVAPVPASEQTYNPHYAGCFHFGA